MTNRIDRTEQDLMDESTETAAQYSDLNGEDAVTRLLRPIESRRPLRKYAQHRRRTEPKAKKTIPGFLLVPALGILLLGLGYPVIWQVVTSFQDYGIKQQFGAPPDWVGLGNYITLFTSADLWGVLIRSLVFCIITAAITMVIGLLLALLMQLAGRTGRLILQISLLLAWAMPVVAAMTVWIWLFDRRRGVVNWLLTELGFDQFYRFEWLSNPLTFFMLASIIVIWMSVPFVAFSLYAGLTQVSDDVMEAAHIDGATGWQRLKLIVLPMIKPVVSIVLLLQLIWDLRVFAQIKLLQDAGSGTTDFDLLGTYIYKLGTGTNAFGMAAAVSILILALTVFLSYPYVRSLMKEDENV